MRFRLLIILGVLAVLTVYASTRITDHWEAAQAHPWLRYLGMAAFFCLQMLAPFGDRLWFPALKRKGWHRLVLCLDWVSYLAFGLMSVMVAYGFAFDIVGIIWQVIAPPDNPARFAYVSFQLYAAAVALTIMLGVWRTRAPVVDRVEVKLANLPAEFEGFTIAQISDLHVGPTIKRTYAQKVVDITNDLNADMVALTGDFVDGRVSELRNDVAPLAGLKSKDGVFFVTGNHECYWDDDAWMAEFKRLGARVLANEHQFIKRGNAVIAIAGVNDPAAGHMDVGAALRGLPDAMTIILLAHQPGTYAKAEAAGVDLQLSGHAHAGQYFPFTLAIRFFQKYYKGLNLHGRLWVYVNRGTGYWGPPLRVGAPPEITLMTLRRS